MSPVHRRLVAVAVALMLLTPVLGPAQQIDLVANRFVKSETRVPMRDGIKLYTTIYVPKAIKGPLPFILLRTPYGAEARGPQSLQSYLKDLADEGYIFVFQDIRGRHKSDGT